MWQGVKIWLRLAAAVLLLALGGYAGFRFGSRLTGSKTDIRMVKLSDLPVAELATRELCWKVVIHEKENFPAREYVVSKIATIKAGFDLTELDAAHSIRFDADTRRVTVTLPAPKVLSVSWSEPDILYEVHSLAAAALTKSNADEKIRQAKFNAALCADLETRNIFDFDRLTEGLKNTIGGFFASHGCPVEFVQGKRGDFSAALRDYFDQR